MAAPNIPGFKVLEKIAEGGSSVIWKILDERNNEHRALKVLSEKSANTPGMVKAFKAEAALLMEMDHEGLVKVFDIGEAYGEHYYVMEYFPGTNLKTQLQQKNPLLKDAAIEIGQKVGQVLLELHLHGILHKDMKPENVLYSTSGRVKCIDLSIAQRKGSFWSSLFKKPVQGTPSYMSPEQIRNEKLDHRSDIYSLGVTLYELVAGQPPFIGKSQEEILQKHLREKPVNVRELAKTMNADFAKLIMMMLEKSPDKRIQDMNLVLFEMNKINRQVKVPGRSTRVYGRSTRINLQAGMVNFFRVDRAQKKGTSINGRGVLTNLSRHGLGFKCNLKLGADEVVEMLATIPPLKQPLKFLGNVVWCTKQPTDTIYSVGVRLNESPPDYLTKFETLKESLDASR